MRWARITSLKSHRRELIDSAIARHSGRIVKTTGDGMLVEFASVVDAVSCAVNIQRSMVRRNAGIARGQADRFPDRDQRRRYHHRRRRYFRRRRQYRRAAGDPVRTRRRLHFQDGQRPDQRQAFAGVRRPRRAGREEHLPRGRRVRTYGKGHRSPSGVGCSRGNRSRSQPRQPTPTNRKSTFARPGMACNWPTPGWVKVLRW